MEVCVSDVVGFVSAEEILLVEGEAGLPEAGFGDDDKLVAHCPQYSKSKGLSKPQLGQAILSGEAHCPQNRMPPGFSNPHFLQSMAESSLRFVNEIKLRILRLRAIGKVINVNMNGLETNGYTAIFKTAEVRDLAWVILSPGLIKAPADDTRLVSDTWCQKSYAAHVRSLRKLDKNPEPLLNYLLALKNHRLGFYFEKLLAFWLEHIVQSSPFKKNVSVFQEIKGSGRRTLGEFDFLFGQKDKQTLNHWEVTVKFYLCHEGEGGGSLWLGPAGQDRFDIKLARILEHQLKLAETPEGRFAVERLSTLPVNAEAFIKGYLFYPAAWGDSVAVDACHQALSLSFGVSSDHLRGWWLRLGEIIFPKRFGNSKWLILPKLRWFSAAWCADAESDMLLDDVSVERFCVHQFEKGNSSLLLAEMQRGVDGWFEVSRGFVVAPTWPVINR